MQKLISLAQQSYRQHHNILQTDLLSYARISISKISNWRRSPLHYNTPIHSTICLFCCEAWRCSASAPLLMMKVTCIFAIIIPFADRFLSLHSQPHAHIFQPPLHILADIHSTIFKLLLFAFALPLSLITILVELYVTGLREGMSLDLDLSDLLFNCTELSGEIEFTAASTGDYAVACPVEDGTLHLCVSAACKLVEIAHQIMQLINTKVEQKRRRRKN